MRSCRARTTSAPSDHPYDAAVLGSRTVVAVDPVLDPADEAAIRELCTRFGRYRTYGELEPIEIPEGPGLAQRHDSVMNFLRSGGLEAAPGAGRHARRPHQLLPGGVRLRR